MLKGGLLGLGTIGKTHKTSYDDILSDVKDFRIDAYFDLAEENLSDINGARAYTDIDEFFKNEADKLDFVDICLPTFMHKDISIRAMKAGLNVICEKPMALNYADAEEMCRVAKETGKTLMIAQPLRFEAEYELIYDYIHSQKLGDVHSAFYTFFGSGLPNGYNNWFKDKKLSGGPVLDVHIHCVDTFNWLFGVPESVASIAYPTDEEKAVETISTNYQYKSGPVVSITTDWAVPKNMHNSGRSLRINFQKGYIIFDRDKFIKVDESGNIENLSPAKDKGPYCKELKYFIECLKNNTHPLICMPEDTAASINIICKELESAAKMGERVTL